MSRFTLVKRPPTHRHIAPRLANGAKRINAGNGLPPIVKDALQAIADAEARSRSWVIEQILIDWCRHDRRLQRMLSADSVAYRPSKADAARAAREHAAEAARAAGQHARRAGGRA